MSYDEWHPKEFFTSLVLGDKQPLQYNPLRAVGFDELRYFYWIYPYNAVAEQTVMIDILLNDQTTINHNLGTKVIAGKWGVCCVPAGFNQLGLNALVPDGTTAISYTIQVKTAGTAIVAPVTYQLEQRNYYNTSQLIYRNSVGGLETIVLRGQVDFEADYARQNVQSTVPPSYFANMVLQAQASDVNSSETPKFKGDTGFLNRQQSDLLRDFFISPQKYELLPAVEDGRAKLLPVTIITKNTKFFSNNENLVTTIIEWLRGYSNEYFTPKRIMPTVRACPALESFAVTQINKNLLQIMYALESPYDRVKIEVETTLGIQTFYFTGNSGTIRQAFTNPVLGTLDTENITVRAYTVCNELSNPMELGPASTVMLDVVGNTLPIANNDTFNIPVGYNTAIVLPASALVNDYDPDGDAIECVPQVDQASNAGGTFSIDIAGIITYLPPSSVYQGQDYFDYEIQEVGSMVTVTARVYINVGTVASAIYCRIQTVITSESHGPYNDLIIGERWIHYYADPAGTLPVDVTALAITFEVDQNIFTQEYTCEQDNVPSTINVLGVGTKTKFFENEIYNVHIDPVYPCDLVFQVTHTLHWAPAHV